MFPRIGGITWEVFPTFKILSRLGYKKYNGEIFNDVLGPRGSKIC